MKLRLVAISRPRLLPSGANSQADPDAVPMCTTKRCYVDNPLSYADVHHQYDFLIRMLDRWPRLHSDIRSLIDRWKAAAQAGPACQ